MEPECCKAPEIADTGSVYVHETVLMVEVIVPTNDCGPDEIDTEFGKDMPGAAPGERPVKVTVPL
jgi:hypothetical protein